MPEPRYIEITEPLTDYTGCVLHTSEDRVTIVKPNGDVVCPPEKGNWTGKLIFEDRPEVDTNEGYAPGYRGYVLYLLHSGPADEGEPLPHDRSGVDDGSASFSCERPPG